MAGQNELQMSDHEAQQQQQHDDETRPLVNCFKINIQTNAVCVDILVWTTRDEYGNSSS
jgi:phosphatidylinositol 4-kinase